MKVSIGNKVKEILSDTERARILTAEMIKNQTKNIVRVKNVLGGNKVLTLRRVDKY